MKKISCSKVGGGATESCEHVVSAETEQEAIDQWHAHYGSMHPEVVADVSEEDKKKWMDAHHGVWEATPDEMPETPSEG